MQRLALVWAAAAAFTCKQHNSRTARRRTIRRLFLEEATFKEDALIWAKETSRTQTRPMTVAAALYDDKSQCVFVGGFDDAALAVAALCRKHGRNVCKGLRYEDFTAARAGGDEDGAGGDGEQEQAVPGFPAARFPLAHGDGGVALVVHGICEFFDGPAAVLEGAGAPAHDLPGGC